MRVEVKRLKSKVGSQSYLTRAELGRLIGQKVFYGIINNKCSITGNYVTIVEVDNFKILCKATTGTFEVQEGVLFFNHRKFFKWCLEGNLNSETIISH